MSRGRNGSATAIPPRTRQPNSARSPSRDEFRHAEIHFESSIMSRPGNPLEFERRNGPTAGMANPTDWESGPKGSDRVGLAGKGNAKAKNWKAKRVGTRFGRESDTKESDRVGDARTKGSARRAPVKRDRRKRPFLENSTACQKSTPDMLIPRPASAGWWFL